MEWVQEPLSGSMSHAPHRVEANDLRFPDDHGTLLTRQDCLFDRLLIATRPTHVVERESTKPANVGKRNQP